MVHDSVGMKGNKLIDQDMLDATNMSRSYIGQRLSGSLTGTRSCISTDEMEGKHIGMYVSLTISHIRRRMEKATFRTWVQEMTSMKLSGNEYVGLDFKDDTGEQNKENVVGEVMSLRFSF